MAFPQETFLNARWSEDQSAAMPCRPSGRAGAVVLVMVVSVIRLVPPRSAIGGKYR